MVYTTYLSWFGGWFIVVLTCFNHIRVEYVSFSWIFKDTPIADHFGDDSGKCSQSICMKMTIKHTVAYNRGW